MKHYGSCKYRSPGNIFKSLFGLVGYCLTSACIGKKKKSFNIFFYLRLQCSCQCCHYKGILWQVMEVNTPIIYLVDVVFKQDICFSICSHTGFVPEKWSTYVKIHIHTLGSVYLFTDEFSCQYKPCKVPYRNFTGPDYLQIKPVHPFDFSQM